MFPVFVPFGNLKQKIVKNRCCCFFIMVAEQPHVWERAVCLVYWACLSWAFIKFCGCPPFPFGIESRMWDGIVLIPDHCHSVYFLLVAVILYLLVAHLLSLSVVLGILCPRKPIDSLRSLTTKRLHYLRGHPSLRFNSKTVCSCFTKRFIWAWLPRYPFLRFCDVDDWGVVSSVMFLLVNLTYFYAVAAPA